VRLFGKPSVSQCSHTGGGGVNMRRHRTGGHSSSTWFYHQLHCTSPARHCFLPPFGNSYSNSCLTSPQTTSGTRLTNASTWARAYLCHLSAA